MAWRSSCTNNSSPSSTSLKHKPLPTIPSHIHSFSRHCDASPLHGVRRRRRHTTSFTSNLIATSAGLVRLFASHCHHVSLLEDFRFRGAIVVRWAASANISQMNPSEKPCRVLLKLAADLLRIVSFDPDVQHSFPATGNYPAGFSPSRLIRTKFSTGCRAGEGLGSCGPRGTYFPMSPVC